MGKGAARSKYPRKLYEAELLVGMIGAIARVCGDPSETDQYVARVGASYAGKSWKGFGASLGGRLEGVPVEDLIGDSNGFRRPGYAISIEPGLSYSRGAYTFSLAVPYALYRNRTRSVADRLVPGRGLRVYGKLEALNPGGSIKDRVALYIVDVKSKPISVARMPFWATASFGDSKPSFK